MEVEETVIVEEIEETEKPKKIKKRQERDEIDMQGKREVYDNRLSK